LNFTVINSLSQVSLLMCAERETFFTTKLTDIVADRVGKFDNNLC